MKATPTKFQIEDESLIQSDIESFKAPKIGDTVNIVMPNGDSRTIGKVLPGKVVALREGGRVIQAEVPVEPTGEKQLTTLTIAGSGAEKPQDLPPIVTVDNCPYASAERLKLKCRLNTWHWPEPSPAA
jgi:hypothetical protein